MKVETFQNLLYDWYDPKARPMPWKEEKNPYKIWISEVILQQTRVNQGWDYYQKFINKFPDVYSLAHAEQDVIMKAWEGLGYYSRARNLQSAAIEILSKYNGKVPNSYRSLIGLKGIGPYTAAAILSFGFGKPFAIVDGNIQRLFSRIFGLDLEINSTKCKKQIQTIADQFLERKWPSRYNQALLDLSAVICKPQIPNCEICPLQKECLAYISGDPTQFPKKKTKKQKQKRTLTYFLFEDSDNVLIKKRNKKDIWQGLYEFILNDSKLDLKLLKSKIIDSKNFYHQLTHQTLKIEVNRIEVENLNTILLEIRDKEVIPFRKDKIHELAFPKILTKYISEIY